MTPKCWALVGHVRIRVALEPITTAKAAEGSKDRLRGVALAGRKENTYLRVFP